jgi:hypothetical protein
LEPPPGTDKECYLDISIHAEIATDINDPSNWQSWVTFNPCFGTNPANESAENCEITRQIATVWNLSEFVVPLPHPHLDSFKIQLPPEMREQAVVDNPAPGTKYFLPFPREIRLTARPPRPDARGQFERAYEYLRVAKGEPRFIRFWFIAFPTEYETCIAACRKVQPVWDCWGFFDKYRRSFNPFAPQPNLPSGEVRIYPVLQYDNDSKVDADKLFVRASVIHTKDESFIELQTSEGRPWLEKAAEYAGCEVDIWEGPIEKRWGLYT